MTVRPDVFGYLKVLDDIDGFAIRDGDQTLPGRGVIVRYVVANDSNTVAGPFSVVGKLTKDNIDIVPDPVPVQKIASLQPNQIWKKEFTVPASKGTGRHEYVAAIAVALNPNQSEEDLKNNSTHTKFILMPPIA